MRPSPPPLPFHLRGAFAPVPAEQNEAELEVVGELPAELTGTYVQNGPNPKSGRSPHWFAGEGMLQGVRLERGRARWHRSRWLRHDYSPNTSVVSHAGHTLALVETQLPVELTPELDTVGVFDFGGALTRSMTAHPKLCPATGELHFFSYAATPPFLVYYRADAAGRVVHRVELDLGFPTFMHDFAITEHYAVFYVLPVLLGDFRTGVPLRWADDVPARLALVPHGGGAEDLRWFEVAPCSIAHCVNAFEDGSTVVLDAVRAPRLLAPHALHRFRLDLASGAAAESRLDARFLDLPRVAPSVVGRRQRYAYVTELLGFGPDGSFTGTASHRYDFDAHRVTTHDFGPGAMPAECLVVPRAGARAEDDAWALLFVQREDGSATELVVLDAAQFEAPPVARVRLAERTAFGLHAAWIPA